MMFVEGREGEREKEKESENMEWWITSNLPLQEFSLQIVKRQKSYFVEATYYPLINSMKKS